MKISRRQVYDFLRSQDALERDSGKAAPERERYLNSVFARVREMVRRIEPKQGMRLLEIGASPYFTSRALVHFLKLEPGQFVMIDGAGPCETGVRRTQKTFFGRSCDLYVLNAETQVFPFPDQSFDYVICQDVIEHLIFDPLFLVQQSHRVLKTGGILILSTSPAVFSWFVTLRHLFNLPVESGYDVRRRDPYARHNRLFSLKEVAEMVAGNGFSVIEAFNTSHPYRVDPLMSLRARFFKRSLYVLDKLTAGLGRVMPFLKEKAGMQIWVLGRKDRECPRITYPPTMNLRGEFEDAP